MNKPTREEVLTLADTVALCGATRLAEVLRRSVKLEAENERMRKALQMVAAQPGFEPEEPYGQAVLGALMSRINYTPDNSEDEVDTYHARDCSIPELTAEVERLRGKCDELFADKERWYRMAELHCSTIAQLKVENDSLQTEIHRLQEEVELWKSRCEDNT